MNKAAAINRALSSGDEPLGKPRLKLSASPKHALRQPADFLRSLPIRSPDASRISKSTS